MKGVSSISLVTIAFGLLSGALGDDLGPTLEDATYDPAVRAEFEADINLSLNPEAAVDAAFFSSDSCVLTQPKDCIKTAATFEKKLQDYTTIELILCNGFTYKANKAFDLSFRTKKVKCAGKCYIKGYHFTPKANSWITVRKAGYQEWCGVTFDDFQGDGVSENSTVQLGCLGSFSSHQYFSHSISFFIFTLQSKGARVFELEGDKVFAKIDKCKFWKSGFEKKVPVRKQCQVNRNKVSSFVSHK